MSDIWHDLVETVLLILILWPGPRVGGDAFAPKKKSWIGPLLQPLRDAHRQFAPSNPILLRATRRCLITAWVLSWMARVSATAIPGLAQSSVWPLVEYGAISLLIGCAVGFWAADRMLRPTAIQSVEAA